LAARRFPPSLPAGKTSLWKSAPAFSFPQPGGRGLDGQRRLALLLAKLFFQADGINEEFGSPVRILKRDVTTRDREAAFHRAARFGRPVEAHRSAHVTIRRECRFPEPRIAGLAVEQQPASCHLDRSSQAGPWNCAVPLAVEPAGKEAIGL